MPCKPNRYFASFEFSLSCLAMGYGTIVPSSTTERISSISCIIIGGTIYTFMVAVILEAISNRNPGQCTIALRG